MYFTIKNDFNLIFLHFILCLTVIFKSLFFQDQEYKIF